MYKSNDYQSPRTSQIVQDALLYNKGPQADPLYFYLESDN